MIDLLQTNNADRKACGKVVQSYKRTIKIAFKIYSKPKKGQLPDKSKHANKIQNILPVLWNRRAGNKPTKPTRY